MPRLTIDGRLIDVPPGTTLLEAARRLRIEIPTLCYRPPPSPTSVARLVKSSATSEVLDATKDFGSSGKLPKSEEPLASCFLCVVQVEGQPTLTPSCSAPAEDGMVVVTDSPDIRDARRTALELLLSDHVGDCLGPCVLACPAGLDVPGFLADLADGRSRDAAARVRDRLPFAASLGRICPRFCESACRRGEVDEPIAIRALHRFVADGEAAAEARSLPPTAAPTGKRVAVVGAGPAGLTAAFDLLQRGHAVTLFDRRPAPGGRFRWSIPAFELPDAVVEAEVEIIRRLGATFRLGTTVGKDVAFQDLRRDFDAVLMAIGAEAETPLTCPGGELALSALAYLERLSKPSATSEVLSGLKDFGSPGKLPKSEAGASSGQSVVVIGSDRAAVAAGRTALRRGADTATVVCPARRPSRGPLAEPVADAEAEGVRFQFQTTPVRIERRKSGDSMPGARREPGDNRPVLSPDFLLTATGPDGGVTVPASVVLNASGRMAEPGFAEAAGLDVGRSGIKVDRATLATGLDGVFAAGEAVTGASYGVRAVAAGHQAAASIHQYLAGRPVVGLPNEVNVRMTHLAAAERDRLLDHVAKAPRAAFQEIEQGPAEADAIAESRRCLQCTCLKVDVCLLRRHGTACGADVRALSGHRREYQREETHPDIVYESGKCIMCGICIRLAEEARETLGLTFIGRGFQVRTAAPFGEPLREALRQAALAAAEACPTGAIAVRGRRRPVPGREQDG